jgi:glycosyltransferase involved in cell wall biosynthesis
MIPNGVDFERFNAAAGNHLTIPEDMKNIPKPILGFIGVLRNWVDTPLLESVARSRPDWSLVLIGPEGDADLTGLKALKNVHFLGAKPNGELPAYLSSFDIALNAFVKSDLTKDVSPLKFYEYLATGKPVVSTGEPRQVLSYKDCIYIGESREGYLKACEEALAETGEEKKNLRIAGAKAASWEGRVEEIVKTCADWHIL